METKPLLYGLIGFFIGGFIVSVAATTFEKPESRTTDKNDASTSMSMDEMAKSLKDKAGDEYDKAFIVAMIDHHEGAVEMAKLSATRAKHDEVKELSKAIIEAQQNEITAMKQWQEKWGYDSSDDSHDQHDR